MVTDQEIADAEAVLRAATTAYLEAKEKVHRLKETQACEEYKVGIGMIVSDRRGRTGVVCRVSPTYGGKPWVYAKQIKKDGSRGERELSMYSDWTVV
ncbi:MAG TPA: hypothetical protein VNY06_01165 [Methylocella sp.]|jgi:hypothetical protein|nr:hypothetical protein [Methylocella sp.]